MADVYGKVTDIYYTSCLSSYIAPTNILMGMWIWVDFHEHIHIVKMEALLLFLYMLSE